MSDGIESLVLADRRYWNILKGLGIIAVVAGHTGSAIVPYVYMYHLALFFFIAGYFYKDKYSAEPFTYAAKKLQRLWLPLAKYGVGFVILHNLFFKINLYVDFPADNIIPIKPFGGWDWFYHLKAAIWMQGFEQLGGALWFIYPLLVGLILFCAIRRLSMGFADWQRELFTAIVISSIYMLGLLIIKDKIVVEYFGDVAMLVMPIIYIGFLANKFSDKLVIKWYICLLCLFIIIAVYHFTGKSIDLSRREIIGPKWFILVSLAGIYANLVFAAIINRWKLIGDIIAKLGEKSFHIMALHFLMFKVVNLLYIFIYDKPVFWLAKFPVIDAEWWLIYTVIGLGGSIGIVYSYEYVKSNIRELFINHKIKEEL